MFRLAILTTFVSLLAAGTQTTGLRIVVLEGEDAVNVIQQRTAVAPLVEVRDKDDHPVAGALVKFGVRRGRAAFNGAKTLTVTTNAAGRAQATGFAPTGTGPLQLSVSASFAGEVATATIAQANVMTAAEVAQAAAVAGGAAGGGLSTGALIGIVAAGAGGSAAAVVATKGGSDTSSGAGAGSGAGGSASCSYSLGSSSQTAPAAGGSLSTALTANCEWSAASDVPWLTLASGSTSGSSGLTLSYTAVLNASGSSRTGHITVSGAGGSAVLTVNQDAGATATLTVTVSPNPTPFSGTPIASATCTAIPNTWFFNVTITETTGVSVSLTHTVDLFDGKVANDVPISIAIAAGGSFSFQSRWCTSSATSHTVQSTYTGTDAFGHAVSVTTPLEVLSAKP